MGREMEYPCLLTGLNGCNGQIVYAGFGLSVGPHRKGAGEEESFQKEACRRREGGREDSEEESQ